jgi:hypothetical protein
MGASSFCSAFSARFFCRAAVLASASLISFLKDLGKYANGFQKAGVLIMR